MRRVLTLLAVPALALLVACGSTDKGTTSAGSGAVRTIDVEMRDIAYSPTSLDVRAGEKVRLRFKNTGQVVHDAFIGDAAAQDQHEKEMRGAHGDHAMESEGLSVKPGKTGELTYSFDTPGQILIGCHEPGHYTGGMKVTVNVA